MAPEAIWTASKNRQVPSTAPRILFISNESIAEGLRGGEGGAGGVAPPAPTEAGGRVEAPGGRAFSPGPDLWAGGAGFSGGRGKLAPGGAKKIIPRGGGPRPPPNPADIAASLTPLADSA